MTYNYHGLCSLVGLALNEGVMAREEGDALALEARRVSAVGIDAANVWAEPQVRLLRRRLLDAGVLGIGEWPVGRSADWVANESH